MFEAISFYKQNLIVSCAVLEKFSLHALNSTLLTSSLNTLYLKS